tara:strand:- start:256 stop:972 length:717 start_codon:yes stop_codon:yes gene_type:complete
MKKNKRVFILGASSDIGLSIMKVYKKNNFSILAHYNTGNKNFFKFIKDNKIESIKFNFLKSNKKIELFLKSKRLKRNDILINALGFITEKTFLETKVLDLEKIFKVNFYPSLILTQNLGLEMNKKKWGRIVNLGSIGVKFGGGINNFPYSISKFLLEFFPNQTKNWVKNNVLINTVRVGATHTKLHLKLPSKNLKKRASLIPMKRFATTNEIAEFIFFLGSNQNTYISNQVLSISGGE